MDIDEAAWRFRANLGVVVAGVIIGILVAGVFGLSRDPAYRASARLVVDAKEPRSVSESRIIADTGRAIIGSEGRVAAALDAAGAKRDVKLFVQNNIRVTPVGSSAVLELSVIDHDPVVAAAVSNSLAETLIQTRKSLSEQRFAEVLGELDRRILNATNTVKRRAQSLQRAAGQRGLSPIAEQYRDAVRLQRELEADRRRVFEDKASVPEPSIIERAALPTDAENSYAVPDLVLGAVLGLVLGVGFAAIRETLRPTVAGDRAIARLLGVPSVGTLKAAPGLVDDASLEAIGGRLRLAAEAAGVRKLALTSTDGRVDLDAFAKRLRAVIDGGEQGSHAASHETRISWEVFSTEGEGLRALRESPSTVGLVLVAPTVFKRRHLDSVMDLRSMTGWQLFGCVMYPRQRWPRRRRPAAIPAAVPTPIPVSAPERDAVETTQETVPTEVRQPAKSRSIYLEQSAAASTAPDKAASAAGVGRSSTMTPEALPPSASVAPTSGATDSRSTELSASSGEKPAVERAAGPEGSLHWAPWGWQ